MLAESSEALKNVVGPSLPQEARETWARIQETVEQFSGVLESGAGPQALARIIDQSGLNLENKLRRMIASDGKPSFPSALEGDLKGLLLKMKAQLERVAPETARELQPPIQKMEFYQLLNAGEGDPSKLLLLIPLLFPEGLRWTEVLLRGSGGGEASPGTRKGRCSSFWTCRPWGNCRLKSRSVKTECTAVSKRRTQKSEHIWRKTESRLVDRLGRAGYLADLEIRVVDPSLLQEILPARLEGFPDSLVSLVV